MRRAGVVFVALVALAGCTGDNAGPTTTTTADDARAGWPASLRVAVSPTSGPHAADAARLLAQTLADQLGVEVVDASASVDADQRAGTLAVLEHGPLSQLAAERTGTALEVVAGEVSSRRAAPGYYAVGVALAGEGIRQLADLAGRRVCLLDGGSAAGDAVPRAALRAGGTAPAELVRAGPPTGALASVRNGDCDAAFVPDAALAADGDGLASFWQSPLLPSAVVTVSPSLPATLREAITRVVVEDANQDRCDACGNASGGWGYAPSSAAALDVLRRVCATGGTWPC